MIPSLHESRRFLSHLKSTPFHALPSMAEAMRSMLQSEPGAASEFLRASPTTLHICLALHRTFNTPLDQIVWETSPGSDFGLDGWKPEWSGDTPEFMAVRPDQALAAARGMAAVRALRRAQHWIVCVADRDLFLRDLRGDTVAQLQAIGPRFALLLCHSPSKGRRSNGSPLHEQRNGDLETAWLADLGLAHAGESTLEDVPDLADRLAQFRAEGRSFVLQVAVPPSDPERRRDEPILLPASAFVDSTAQMLDAELLHAAHRDHRLWVVSLAAELKPAAFAAHYPQRLFEAVDQNSHALIWCVAVAQQGHRPIILARPEDLARDFDPWVRDICGRNLPVTLIVQDEPFGATRQEAAGLPARIIPNWPGAELAVPADALDLRRMLVHALDLGQPVVVDLTARDQAVPLLPVTAREGQHGRAEILRNGNDVALVAAGTDVHAALETAAALDERGVQAMVINARYLTPIDRDLLCQTAGQVRQVVAWDRTPGSSGLYLAVAGALAGNSQAAPLMAYAGRFSSLTESARDASRHALVREICDLLAANSAPAGHLAWGPPLLKRRTPLLVLDEAAERAEVAEISETPLSPDLERWLVEYWKFGKRRRYLWQWCRHGVELTRLPCVPPELREALADSKVLSIMVNVLLDDIADCRTDGELMAQLLRVVSDRETDTTRLSPEQQQYVAFTQKVWQEYWYRARQLPRYAQFSDLLAYDLGQLFNTIHYSYLLNRRLALLNGVEHDLYSPHNMMMMSFATLDLMCATGLRDDDLGKLREAVWHAQWMGRIGNLLSTWTREIYDGDFTSGVFARAVSAGQLTVEELQAGDAREIHRAVVDGAHDQYYRSQWRYHRDCFEALAAEIQVLDLRPMVTAHDRFLLMHLGSRGRI